ncbi:MAG: cytochrome P450 [Gammaproteobacteria bacterium BRH_c0]|nr:MAG: cytochrome P450 [Gammaproteobacteria bacterium BRH_c0]
MTSPSSQAASIPAHVPADLVESFPLVMGQYSAENPFARIVPEACKGPDVAYALDIVPGGGSAWILRRKEDLHALYFDTEHFSSKGYSSFAKFIGETWNQVPTELDPPEHTLFRVALNPLFSPPKMMKMEDDIRHRARHLINQFKDRGSCELMGDFAFPFPVAIVLDLMNLPQERMDEFRLWEHMMLHTGEFSVLQEGARLVTTYLRGVIAERKKNPGEDLISYAINAKVDGRSMTDDELIGYAFNLYIGGLDTVSANIGNQLRYLAEHPEQQQYLRDNPAAIKGAVEEFMRVFAAVTTFRTCIKETTIRGVTIKPGDKVATCTTLAGRDGEAYDNPHEVIFDRNAPHVSFAVGPHFCLGVHLARRELRIALEELLAALPAFSIEPGAQIESQLGGIIQPKILPLRWNV